MTSSNNFNFIRRWPSFTFLFALVFISFATFSCEKEQIAPINQTVPFDEAYLSTHPEVLGTLLPAFDLGLLETSLPEGFQFDADRLDVLASKDYLTKIESNDLNDHLQAIGFPDKAAYLSYKASLFNLGEKLVKNTDVELLSSEVLRSVIRKAIISNPSNRNIGLLEKATPCNSKSYLACENDVSAALAGDLAECVVGTVVTGLFTGGLPAIVVGGACAGNALYQGAIASRACVRNFCP